MCILLGNLRGPNGKDDTAEIEDLKIILIKGYERGPSDFERILILSRILFR